MCPQLAVLTKRAKLSFPHSGNCSRCENRVPAHSQQAGRPDILRHNDQQLYRAFNSSDMSLEHHSSPLNDAVRHCNRLKVQRLLFASKYIPPTKSRTAPTTANRCRISIQTPHKTSEILTIDENRRFHQLPGKWQPSLAGGLTDGCTIRS